ncbi:MAG: hypothetical protein VXV97_17425, partial [Pseudomonadota bacterium]|nr:hypothetical protein [Pseudomonadota bacterium]
MAASSSDGCARRATRCAARSRCEWHDSQQAAAVACMLFGPHSTTSPSYSRFSLGVHRPSLAAAATSMCEGGGGGESCADSPVAAG